MHAYPEAVRIELRLLSTDYTFGLTGFYPFEETVNQDDKPLDKSLPYP